MITQKKNILDNFLAAFGSISPANGYQTSIGAVDRHRDMESAPYDTTELWAVNVRDGIVQVDHLVSEDEHRIPVTLDIITTSAATVDEIDTCTSDVIQCLAANSTCGGFADGITLESHGIDFSQVGEFIFAATVEITIHYTTEPGRI